MLPKGIIIPIGGGEDKRESMDVLKRVVAETGKEDPIIEVITTATSIPGEVGRDYEDAFRSMGLKNYSIMHIDRRDDADERKYIERLKDADAVLFSGGDQSKLSDVLAGTDFHKELLRGYNEGSLVVAGTSAGAAAMSDTMIVRGSSKESLIKGELELTSGFGFLKGIVVDTHFTERGRFGRLIQAVTTNPKILGIGLGEDTSAIIKDGRDMEIFGSGLVIIVDGASIQHTNLNEVKEGDTLSVDGVTLHVLCQGDRFDIIDRKFIYPDKEQDREAAE
jgi:cyanophycinase